jgi:hypothetical protein
MKIPLDPQHFDLPMALAYQIAGAFISGLGIIATTAYGCYAKIAVISPEELALQPLHVVLILFIVALATFIALILRAVWGKGLSTMNRFADCLDNLTKMIHDVGTKIEQLQEAQNNSLRDYQNLSLDALKSKASKNDELTKERKNRKD